MNYIHINILSKTYSKLMSVSIINSFSFNFTGFPLIIYNKLAAA